MSLSIYGESDIGCTRTRNEDAIGWCQSSNGSHAVLVLADGMGGHGGGDVASKIVVDSVMAELSPWVERADVSGLDAINTLNRAVSNANNQIRHAREGDAERSKMGTTLLILWIKNDQAFIANVGDSRCYCLSRSGR